MSEPSKDSSVLGAGLRAEIKQIVLEAMREAAGNGTGGSPSLLDIEQAAKFLRVPKSWVGEAARRGELPSVKLGHYTRFRPEDLAQFIGQKQFTRR